MHSVDPTPPSRPLRFLVSTTGPARDIRRHMGSADYSYAFVLDAFRPVLESLGTWRLVERPESQLAHAVAQARIEGDSPIHLAFVPPQSAYFTPTVDTVLFPFWEFPNVPDRDFSYDTRQNWARMIRPASLIVTACEFTAGAFRQAGAACPVAVVPVPIGPEPFSVPDWEPERKWTITCRHLVWDGTASTHTEMPSSPRPRGFSLARAGYRRAVRPWLSDRAIVTLSRTRRALSRRPEPPPPLLPERSLTLSGLVFTSIFNLSDRRKNPADLLSAFLMAFHDRPDATLVLKLATSPTRECHELQELRALYATMGVAHRCRVVVITDYLDDDQMRSLLQVSTFYVNTSRAEGACLPLQQALASGRPAIAPAHTAMADFIDQAVGLVVGSHPEPTFWPHDPERRHETTWHRLVWSDLRDALLRAATLVASDHSAYRTMANAARQRMAGYASRDVVSEALRRALTGRRPATLRESSHQATGGAGVENRHPGCTYRRGLLH